MSSNKDVRPQTIDVASSRQAQPGERPVQYQPPLDDPLGTAQWADDDVVRDHFLFDASLFSVNSDGLTEGRANGQIWLGETIDTGHAIGYKDDRHVFLSCAARGGKGTGVIVPNLCLWPGSCVVIDPKGENATITARRRGDGSDYCLPLGQSMRILDPFDEIPVHSSLKARYNPLSGIDPNSDFAVEDAGRIASAIVVPAEKVNDPFWYDMARSLIKVLILHVVTDPLFDGQRNLVSVWKLLNQGDWQSIALLHEAGVEPNGSAFDLLWQTMRQNSSFNGIIRGIGNQMIDMSEKTRSGVLNTAVTQLEFMDGAAMQRILEASDFELSELKTSPRGLSLYLTLPQRFMPTHYRWLRLMINLAVGEMEHRKGRPATGYPTLFLLDEFAGLKRMEEIEHAAAQAAGFGVKFFFVLQNLAQLKEVYKESWETFLGNSGVKIFFHVDDNFTRSYLSQQLGEREITRLTRSTSNSTSESISDSISDGDSQSRSRTAGGSTTIGTNASNTRGRSTGGSSGYSSGHGGSSSQSGSNWSTSTSHTRGQSHSESITSSTSDSISQSSTRTRGVTQSMTDGSGASETLHKRALLNPDEIGRQFARRDNRNDPYYPGLMLVLIPGQHAIELRRLNYFGSARFEGFYDPHPDHPPPPTLAELIASKRKVVVEEPPLSEPPPRPKPVFTVVPKSTEFNEGQLVLLLGLLAGSVLAFLGGLWTWFSSDLGPMAAAIVVGSIAMFCLTSQLLLMNNGQLERATAKSTRGLIGGGFVCAWIGGLVVKHFQFSYIGTFLTALGLGGLAFMLILGICFPLKQKR